MHPFQRLLFTMLTVCLVLSPAAAVNDWFLNNGTTDWDTASNWDRGIVPDSAVRHGR